MSDSKPHETFAEALKHGPLVFDGAIGTELYRHHVFTNRCFEEQNLVAADLVRQIHENYLDAGADVLTTNTFGANRAYLGQFGLMEQCSEIVRTGAEIARAAADSVDRPVYVAGSIGPLPLHGRLHDEIEEMIVEQAEALMDGGADFILFETQPSREAVEYCARAMQALPDVPIVISIAVTEEGVSALGESIDRLFAPLPESGTQPIAWGINCGTGPDSMIPVVEHLIRQLDHPLIVQPNAGQPKEIAGRQVYLCSPEYFTEYAKRFIKLGAVAVGGCCGTTPDHIEEMSRAVKSLAGISSTVAITQVDPSIEPLPEVPLQERSALGAALADGSWITSVELVPPRGYDLKGIVDKCKTLAERGVTAINIPDGPRASCRISPMVTSHEIFSQAGIEPILHFCCRDRNLIGMQSDLLGCAALDVRNILFVTGDPPKLGPYPSATGVFDTDSIGMVKVQKRLNQGIDLGDELIGEPTRAVIGVGLDPTALDREKEIHRFHQKVEGGAEFAITQPVFDPEALLRFLDEVGEITIPIIAGVWPLASLRNALFLKNEVPGVEMPDSILARMEAIDDRKAQREEGIRIARESIERIRDRIVGVQVSAPFGNIETAWSVICD